MRLTRAGNDLAVRRSPDWVPDRVEVRYPLHTGYTLLTPYMARKLARLLIAAADELEGTSEP